VPYYYANDTYYDWNGDQQQYEVVEPPAGMDSASTDQPPPGDAVFVYPRKGQSAQQQARDRYECHQSAAAHSGYDPTQTGTDLLPEVAADKRADYLRDEAACLDTRHYDVR
jgi:hypothetical protein